MQDPEQVAHGLTEIAALLTFAGEPKFKVKAYEHAAQVVRTLGAELPSLIEQERLRELQGIGGALAAQIRELWNTGTSEYLLRLLAQHPEGAGELIQLEGLTPRRIRALYSALGIRSVEELRVACRAGRVRMVKGFGEKTEERLLAACERWRNRGEDLPRRLLLPRALELAAIIERRLLEVAHHVQLAGALRRGQESVAELEFVVRGDGERALRHLVGIGQVLRVDVERRVAHSSDGVPILVHGAEANFGGALFFATGNGAHVNAVSELATRRGFALARPEQERNDEQTLAPREFATERELYATVGLAFVPPELRHGGTELEEAAGGDFADLVDVGDLQGMVHCHTTYSDGKNSIAEMAAAAHALGMKYITITDHSPSAHYARGVTLDRLEQQWDEIAAAQERIPIRILRGTESDILADGQLDFPDAVLEKFDVVIASVHARYRMDRATMTRRLVRAMSLPVFKIWGHALGRILSHRDPLDCDVPAVLDALAASRGAIEINADPHRLDLPPEWIPTARARRIPFVISVDAHSTRGFGALRYGVTMARRGGLRKRDVLNTEPAETFAELVRPV